MRGTVSMVEEDVMKPIRAADPDWSAVVNAAVNGAWLLLRTVYAMRESGDPLDKIGLAAYEKAALTKIAVEQKLEEY